MVGLIIRCELPYRDESALTMANPWEAEVPLTAELAKRLIDEQFPELSPASLERFGAGWDNTVWFVNGTYVFRFPRRQLGADCLEVEVVVLPQIADRLPLPISNPTVGDGVDS